MGGFSLPHIWRATANNGGQIINLSLEVQYTSQLTINPAHFSVPSAPENKTEKRAWHQKSSQCSGNGPIESFSYGEAARAVYQTVGVFQGALSTSVNQDLMQKARQQIQPPICMLLYFSRVEGRAAWLWKNI